MITPVSGAGVVVMTETIHILGGFGISNTLSNNVQIYDPASNSWSVGISMLEARAEFGAVLLKCCVFF